MEKPHGFGVNIGSQLDINLKLFPHDCKLNMTPKLLCLLIRKQIWKDDLLDRYFFDFEEDIIRKIPLYRFEQADVLTLAPYPKW